MSAGMVLVVSKPPPRLNGRLVAWLWKVRGGACQGTDSNRLREMTWAQVTAVIAESDVIITWSAPRDAGFDLAMARQTCLRAVGFDAVKHVAPDPKESPISARPTNRTINKSLKPAENVPTQGLPRKGFPRPRG